MVHRTKDRDSSITVSASKLARMGVCEQQMVLEHRHGRVLSPEQQLAAQRGRRLHAAFLHEGDARPAIGRCFIATHVFGADAPETKALRRYRDHVLRSSGLGRRLRSGDWCGVAGCC